MNVAASRSYHTTSRAIDMDSDAVRLLRALKGAPFSCLAALHIAHPGPLGRSALQTMTGYAKDAITSAMNLLVNVYGFASRVGRFESWCLTTRGLQLKLPGFSTLLPKDGTRAPLEGDFSALAGSSGSSFIPSSIQPIEQTTPTTTEGDFSALEPLPPELTDLLDDVFLGCPRTLAETAMRAALKETWTPRQIECEALLWALYAESPLGSSIHTTPARFAARKIEHGEMSPDFLHRVDVRHPQTGAAWERWSEFWSDRIRRAKTLLNEVYPR